MVRASSFHKIYPEKGVASAWAQTKGLEVERAAFGSRTKSLINIVAAARIPRRYCIRLDIRFPKELGATDDGIAETEARAGLTRH